MAAQTQARVHHEEPIFRLGARQPALHYDPQSYAHHGLGQSAVPRQHVHLGLNAPPRIPQSRRLNELVAGDEMLRRKTPNGTLNHAYDGTSMGAEVRPHAAKHLVIPAPLCDGMLQSNHHMRERSYDPHLRRLLRSHMHHALPMPGSHNHRSPNPAPIDFGLIRNWSEAAMNGPRPIVDSGMNSYRNPPPQVGDGQMGFNVMQPPMQQPFGPTASQDSIPYSQYWAHGTHPPPQNWQQSHTISQQHRPDYPNQPFHVPLQQSHHNGMRKDTLLFDSRENFNVAHQLVAPLQNYSINDSSAPAGTSESFGLKQQPSMVETSDEFASFQPESPFTRADVDPDVLLRSAHQLYEQLTMAVQQIRKGGDLHELSSLKIQIPKAEIYPDALRREVKQANRSYRKALAKQHQMSLNESAPCSAFREPYRHSLSVSKRRLEGHGQAGLQHPNAWNAPHKHPTFDKPGALPSLAFPQHTSQGRSQHDFSMSAHLKNVLIPAVYNALPALKRVIYMSNFRWIDGLLMSGSLSYAVGDFQTSLQTFYSILEYDPENIMASANIAICLLALERRDDAEAQWRAVIETDPAYLPPLEHMVGLLCFEQRHKAAALLIHAAEERLRSPEPSSLELSAHDSMFPALGNVSTQHGGNASHFPLHFQGSALHQRYQCHPDDNGRFLALLHCKANILYTMKDQIGAAHAFEEVVLTAAGQLTGGISQLISTITTGLVRNPDVNHKGTPAEALLLTPEEAMETARLCYPPNGTLPGLRKVSGSHAMKAAMSVTSNSLLSLAKIFQDSMSPNATSPASPPRQGCGVPEILLLYYLSFALQPSPSAANNVGILLAGIQNSTIKTTSLPTPSARDDSLQFPGVTPGSGIALALMYYKFGLTLDAKHAHLYTNLGSLLKDIGQLPFAIQMYEKAVVCDPTFDIALANLANAVKDQGKVNEAIEYYKRAVQVNPGFAEAACGLANALNSVCNWIGRGGIILARGRLDRWHVNDTGELVDACQSGTSSGWVKRVVDIVEDQLRDGESWGKGLLKDEQIEILVNSVSQHQSDSSSRLALARRVKTYLKNMSTQSWAGARLIRLIERAIRQIAWTWYHDRYTRRIEMPDSAYTRPLLPAGLTVSSAPTILPFHTFTFPMTARQIRLISQKNGLRVSTSTLRAPWLPKIVFAPPKPPAPQLIVGYVSSDFNNHPLAHLMQSVFGFHDKSKVKAICYATTPSDNSIHRHHIEREAPVFYDVSSWSTERIVSQIVADGCHVLINLNGYTRGARNEIFAARPAPVQMSFMGFAGSLGAEWCDYLLTDEIASPPETLRRWRSNAKFSDLEIDNNFTSVLLDDEQPDWVYQENVVYTRYTFFCCDHLQSSPSSPAGSVQIPPNIAPGSFEAELARRMRMRRTLFPDLPPNTLILANFNQLYKIDPSTFRTWLRILSRLPNAIIWLLRFPDAGEANLLNTARLWAGEHVARRVRFTEVAAKAEHIRRACIADLFLDTPECNAHTTAADCLWSGTPLLTLRRYKWKMASRMAASILAGALGVPSDECERAAALNRGGRTSERVTIWNELVAENEEDYEEKAVRLGQRLEYLPQEGSFREGKCWGRLVDMRRLLWEGRWTAPLFDTRRWVSDLEVAYAEVWRRWVEGRGGDVRLREVL